MKVGDKVKINCPCASCDIQQRNGRTATITRVISGLFFIWEVDVQLLGEEAILRYDVQNVKEL